MSIRTNSLPEAAASSALPAGRLIVTARNNFVERPWGGTWLRAFKSLCPLPDQVELTGNGIGESFELAAFDGDAEAAMHPSKVVSSNGGVQTLQSMLREHADVLLGEDWIAKYGECIPLLPKFLNVRELLSVQGHPPGHTEAYVVVDTQPGATIRLGFRHDIDAAQFGRVLADGRKRQLELERLLGEKADWHGLQRRLAAWFAGAGGKPNMPVPDLLCAAGVSVSGAVAAQAETLIESLRETYWYVLDSMNEIELEAGQVIHNCVPQRILEAGHRLPAAEVHALGNPQQREFTLLEVRRPGPTLRAWDNARFPVRDVDLSAALDVLNLSATRPDEFICDRVPGDSPGHSVSVDSPYFRIEHYELSAGETFEVRDSDPHCVHVLRGSVAVTTAQAGDATLLRRGDSAFVPFGVQHWHALVHEGPLHLVRVRLP